jgi:predicted RNA binding protein with dsRBD fold (UPF0201 family)
MKSSEVNKDLYNSLTQLLKTRAAMVNEEHPDSGELASFFYGKTGNLKVAAHLAVCHTCAEEVALYAKAEQAAASYKPGKKQAGEVSAAAWQLIRDWEESGFARPKTESETLSAELLMKFARVLSERQSLKQERRSVTAGDRHQVTVFILNRSGEFRGSESFEKVESKSGEVTLKCSEQSTRFDNKQLYALMPQGKHYAVEAYSIERNHVRVGKSGEPEVSRERLSYFIIED